MNNRLKKALYESIMKSVAKQVKKALNESDESNDLTEYLKAEAKKLALKVSEASEDKASTIYYEALDSVTAYMKHEYNIVYEGPQFPNGDNYHEVLAKFIACIPVETLKKIGMSLMENLFCAEFADKIRDDWDGSYDDLIENESYKCKHDEELYADDKCGITWTYVLESIGAEPCDWDGDYDDPYCIAITDICVKVDSIYILAFDNQEDIIEINDIYEDYVYLSSEKDEGLYYQSKESWQEDREDEAFADYDYWASERAEKDYWV